MNKDLIIIPPDGFEVDKEKSTFEKIVFKPKGLTYDEIAYKLFASGEGYYISTSGRVVKASAMTLSCADANNATSEEQLQCILAKNKLANVAKYLNDGWKPGKTNRGHFDAWVLYATPEKDFIAYVKIDNCAQNSNALFKSKELAQQAIEILGEETIKLALEPLY